MAIASSDLHKAVNTVWDANNLNPRFTNLWEAAKRTDFPALHDQEAAASQPFPYCVFEIEPGATTSRMSGCPTQNQEIRDIPVSFRVHARKIDGVGKTAKKIASDLIEDIIQIFGGHPTIKPKDLVLDNGNFLITQFQTDWGIRTDDKNYQWLLSYIMRIDVPVAI